MIGYLHGTVIARRESKALLLVQEVGYWVFTGSWLPEGEVECFIHHHVREEASDLYGFPNLPALTFFERLITISGIGPKAALNVLSLGSVETISQAIARKDTTFLSSAPGIGAKAAQKIILELFGKIDNLDELFSGSNDELFQALHSLGYSARDIQPYLEQLPSDITDFNNQLRWVLQQIGKK